MTNRRGFMFAAGAALLGSTLSAGAQLAPRVTLYKHPACGCCGEWAKHMQANGFRVETHLVEDLVSVRLRHGISDSLASCHTALIGGYVIEGHVPADDVWRLLRERPAVTGLSVPGMPVGSPGMEQGPPEPYATIAFGKGGLRVFARH